MQINNLKKFFTSLMCLKALNELQSQFVMIQASNNVSFICKHFYMPKLLKEFGLVGQSSETYKQSNEANNIINKTIIDIKEFFSVKSHEDNRALPTPYWLPKIHMSLIGCRFIIASKRCTTKELRKRATSAFKIIYNSVKKYHEKSRYFSGTSSFWVC